MVRPVTSHTANDHLATRLARSFTVSQPAASGRCARSQIWALDKASPFGTYTYQALIEWRRGLETL
jgi:hypothetical protein